MNSLTITVPLTPPSVNNYVRHTRDGRHYITKEAKAFLEAVEIFSKCQTVDAEAYLVEVKVYLGKDEKGDLDNFQKCVLDGLARAGVIHSDAAVTRIEAEKFRDRENPRTEITVSARP